MTAKELAAILLRVLAPKIAAIEARVKGVEERSVPTTDEQVIRAIVDSALKGFPVWNGELSEKVLVLVREEVKKIPQPEFKQPKDGDPGRDALQIDPLPYIDPDRAYARGTYASHRGGIVRAARTTDYLDTLKPGETVETKGWQVMVNGIHEQTVEEPDERTTITRTIYTDGRMMEHKKVMPVLIYRDIWREGTYERGDTVTWAGSLWHCQGQTMEKPGTGKGWKLAVKRGADAKAPAVAL